MLKYTISHQITVQKSQMPTEKSSGQLSTGMKAHGKPWCYRRESLKSIMPEHSDWEQGLWGLQPEGFEPHFCFCSTLQPLSCPRSFHAVEEMASANNQATHGSCTLHTASQVQGAIQPHALPILALKTSSIQKLLCNSQFKHIPDFILILSPVQTTFFFSSPTKYNHPLFDLFTSVLLPFSVLYPSLPHSLLNNWQMEKN